MNPEKHHGPLVGIMIIVILIIIGGLYILFSRARQKTELNSEPSAKTAPLDSPAGREGL